MDVNFIKGNSYKGRAIICVRFLELPMVANTPDKDYNKNGVQSYK